VDSVPAGKYAKAAFTSLGMWEGLASRTAQVESVRAALLLVARGETPLGVVYGSDALAEPRVKVLATFPEDSHPPIVYPVAKVKASTHPQAAAFVRWLRTPAASTIFHGHGFSVLRASVPVAGNPCFVWERPWPRWLSGKSIAAMAAPTAA